MDTGVKRGLGVALLGVLAWGLAALGALALEAPSLPVETMLGLVAVLGIVAIFGGLGRVAWLLLRS